MILVIKNGYVLDYGPTDADWSKYDDSYEVVEWDGDTAFLYAKPAYDPEEDPLGVPPEVPADPRTAKQKADDAKLHYLQRRKRTYPSTEESLMMIYWDMKNGTSEFADAIDAVNITHPKPV